MYPITHDDIAGLQPCPQGLFTFQQLRPDGIINRADLTAYFRATLHATRTVTVGRQTFTNQIERAGYQDVWWLYNKCQRHVPSSVHVGQHSIITHLYHQHPDHPAWQPHILWRKLPAYWTIDTVFSAAAFRMLSETNDSVIDLLTAIITRVIEWSLPILRLPA